MNKSLNKTYVVIGTFVLAWIILLVIALVPLTNLLKAEVQNYKDIQTKIARVNNQWRDVSRLTQEQERLNQYLPQIDRIFLKKESALDFIEAVETLARLTVGDFKINNIESGAKAKAPLAVAQGDFLTFQLDFSSDFASAMQLIALLENTAYLVEIDSIRLNRIDERAAARLGALEEGAVTGLVLFNVLTEK